jgi:hypothetical protein
MNNIITKTALGIAVGLLALATAASADAIPAGRFQIPFQFLVGNTALPAGDYTVKIDTASKRIELVSWNGSAGLVLTANAPQRDVAGPRTGKLVFYKYGNTQVLREMWRSGATYGHELPASSMEREMANQGTTYVRNEITHIGASSK